MAMRALGSILLAGGVLAAGPVLAGAYPGNQGASWADIAKLPQISAMQIGTIRRTLRPRLKGSSPPTRPRATRTRTRPTACRRACPG